MQDIFIGREIEDFRGISFVLMLLMFVPINRWRIFSGFWKGLAMYTHIQPYISGE